LIDERLLFRKGYEYKSRQLDIIEEMKCHEMAKESYVIANIVLTLAA